MQQQDEQQTLQPKLVVGAPNDEYEQEADRVADQVMQMPVPQVQQQMDGEENENANLVQTKLSVKGVEAGSIQRQVCMIEDEEVPLASEEVSTEEEASTEEEETSVAPEPVSTEEEEPIRTKSEEGAIQKQPSIQRAEDGKIYTSPDITQQIEQTKGQGDSLPSKVQQELGSKMAADFSDVKIHTDSSAIQMSKELGSHAFTHGKDIYFNSGKYNPDSFEGKHLLAHELTHTMQQNNKVVQRLSITVQSPLAKGPCGQRQIRWIFSLGSAAPETGYIVQQVDEYNKIVDCPSFGSCLARPTNTFWEAWFVNKGDTHEHLHSSLGYTDQSSFPGGPKKAGYRVHEGEVKFYPMSVTGDLGKDGVAPASPNGGWGPGSVPITGDLPSTKTPPSWWSNTPTEGPETRQAYSAWRCCGDSRDFNVVKARP
jgi:hypothetical protein